MSLEVDQTKLAELVQLAVSRITDGKGQRLSVTLRQLAEDVLKLVDPTWTGNRRRIWARLTAGFQAECPACGALLWPAGSLGEWDITTQRIKCTGMGCKRSWAIGLVLWPVAGLKTGVPDDLEPSWQTLAKIRAVAGSFAAEVPRRRRDRVNLRGEDEAAQPPSECPPGTGDTEEGGRNGDGDQVAGDELPDVRAEAEPTGDGAALRRLPGSGEEV